MAPPDSTIPPKLLRKLLTAGGAPMLLIMIVIFQYILKLEFTCPCSASTEATVFLGMYMVLPALAFFFVVLLTDRQSVKTFRYCCIQCCPCNCSSSCGELICKCLGKGLVVASIWIIMALFDGDWYTCLRTYKQHEELFCKKGRAQNESMILNYNKSESQTVGFGVLCCILLAWLLYVLVFLRKNPYYKEKYEAFQENETHKHVNEKLQNMAKDKANNICAEPLRIILEQERQPLQEQQQQQQAQQPQQRA